MADQLDTLKAQAEVVRDEIVPNENSAARVGQVFVNIIEFLRTFSQQSITPAQKAWVQNAMEEDMQAAADAAFSITTESTTLTFNGDTTAAANCTATVTVKLTFAGVRVKANSVPSGWTEVNGSGGYEYTKAISSSTAAEATSFAYTVPAGDASGYEGITVRKSSTRKAVSIVYPAYYGFCSSKTGSVGSFVGSLTRITSNLSTTRTMTNSSGAAAYLVIVSKGTSTAKQLGANIMDAAVSSGSFTSPQNSNISLSGFNVYYSSLSVLAGGSLNDVEFNIRLS